MNLTNRARRVERVKALHERALLAIDGVQGVGVGEHEGRPAITVFVVNRQLVGAKIPHELDRIPVYVEESGGAFQAL
ncbi:hypothetical protein OG848_27965 [Streptomyces canus]|uniref:hypothetical protein n=1 Tax=Streptomyces canus TaxID=58343 RepID=UPI00324D2D98